MRLKWFHFFLCYVNSKTSYNYIVYIKFICLKEVSLKKRLFKVLIILAFIILVILFFLIKDNNQFKDTITYKGKTYVLLEYNMEIFTYHFNRTDYFEVDIIHPVFHNKWDIIYFNGDLYILDSQLKKATEYYSNDKNYKWFVVFDDEYEK